MKIEVEFTDTQLTQIAQRVALILRVGKSDTYSVKETAAKLGVIAKTVDRRIKAGLIPQLPNLKSVRIPAAFIDKLVNPTNDQHDHDQHHKRPVEPEFARLIVGVPTMEFDWKARTIITKLKEGCTIMEPFLMEFGSPYPVTRRSAWSWD